MIDKNNENNVCILCEQNDSHVIYSKLRGYQEPNTFDINYCTNCNTSYAFPHCDTEKLYELIYNNGTAVPGYHRYWKYADVVSKISNPLQYLTEKESPYWAVSKAVSEYTDNIKKNPRIIEIGSGLGYFTYALKKAGYNIIGLDISEKAVENAKQRYGDFYISGDLYKYSIENSGLYDLVILTEVIEHIEDISSFISALSKLIQPKGQIIITTPNKSIYPSTAVWVSDFPPVHYWWLSKESFMYIAEKLNMKVSFVDFTEFYKNNFTIENIDFNKDISKRSAVFNITGDLLISRNKSGTVSDFQLFLIQFKRIKIVHYLYNNFKKYILLLKHIHHSNVITFGKNGYICAILQKS